VQLRVEVAEEAALQVVGERLAATDDAAQRSALLAQVRLFEEDLQHRGHEVHHRDLLVGDQAGEVGVVVMAFGPRHDHARPEHQRPEEFPERDVEAVGRLQHHAFRRVEPVDVAHPLEAVDDAAVRAHRALRFAGRARGVDDVGEVVGRDVDRRVVPALGLDLAPVGVEADGARAVRGQDAEQPLLCEEHSRAAVVEHERESFRRVGGVERQVGAAGLEDAVEPDDHLDGTLDADGDDPLDADPRAQQVVRQPVGPLVQLPVGEVPPLEGHGHGVGRARGLRLEEVVESLHRRVGDGRLVPPLDEPPPLRPRGRRRRSRARQRRAGTALVIRHRNARISSLTPLS
jgi:hypothetical protein